MIKRTYLLELTGSFLLYAGALAASVIILDSGTFDPVVQAAIALLPVIPGVLIAWVILRQINRLDEFQRKVQLDSLAIAAAGTALITFSYGFLEGVGFPKLSMFYVWPIMSLLWAFGCTIKGLGGMLGARRA